MDELLHPASPRELFAALLADLRDACWAAALNCRCMRGDASSARYLFSSRCCTYTLPLSIVPALQCSAYNCAEIVF